MLLEAGADARAMDINGCAPIQYLLKVTDVRPAARPDHCYQLLLNYNAARIYPPQFHKVRTRRLSFLVQDSRSAISSKCDVLCRSCSPATTTPQWWKSWSTLTNV